jgi:hypothetical protein
MIKKILGIFLTAQRKSQTLYKWLKKVIISAAQTFLIKNPNAQYISGSLRIYMLPNTLMKIMKVGKSFLNFCPSFPGILSHMKKEYVAQNNNRNSCEHDEGGLT